MKSLHRLMLPLGIALGMLTASVALAGTVSADDPPRLSQIDQAINDINSCLASAPAPVLDVYFLMDGSGSLANDNGRPGADPDGIRFDAVEESIAPLAELAGAAVEVNVAAGTFGNGASQALPWTQIDPQAADSLAVKISSDLRSSFNRENTNWVAGLTMAEEQLEISRRSGPRCQTLIWITDGGINLTNDSQANAEGIEKICGVDPTQFGEAKALGSMFRLRNSGVVVLGILLSDPKSPNESRTTYFAPVVEGSGPVDAEYFGGGEGDFACGQVEAGATGAALPAETPSDLADELWAISVCITEDCLILDIYDSPLPQDSDGNWILPVPSGVAAAVIRPRSDEIRITDPDGTVLCQDSESCGLSGGSLRLDVLGEPGLWLLATDGDRAPLARFLSEVDVSIDVPGDLIAGEPAGIVAAALQAGEPLRPELYDSFGWTWKFDGDDGTQSSGTAGSGGSLRDLAPAVGGYLTVTLNGEVARTESAGIAIPSVSLTVGIGQPIRVRPVGDYPELLGAANGERDLLVFPAIEGIGSSVASMEIRGPSDGGGLVCLDAPSVDSDPGIAEGRTLSFSSEYECATGGRQVGAGEIVQVPITASVDEQFNGIARGSFSVRLEPSDGGRAFPSSIDFEVPTSLQRNDGAAFATIAFLTLLGLVLPYLALLFFARRQATFSAGLDGSRYASLPIRLTPEGLASIGEMSVSDYSFIYMDRGSFQREISTAALSHKIEPPRLWPFSPIKCEAHGPANSMVVSNLSGDLSSMGSVAPSSQALPDVFVAHFERPSGGGPTTGSAAADDWGFDLPGSSSPAVALDDQILEGQLVVILPESGNPADVAERAIAKVRVWPRWQEVFFAVMSSSHPVVGSSSAAADSPSQVPPRENPLSDW